jgi:hypothetical protein
VRNYSNTYLYSTNPGSSVTYIHHKNYGAIWYAFPSEKSQPGEFNILEQLPDCGTYFEDDGKFVEKICSGRGREVDRHYG